jgi:ADP-ribose pyrophosphatase
MKPTIINSNKLFEIVLDELRFPDGNEAHYISLKYPESVAILPIIDKNKIVMVRQFRYAINEYSWEIPAGGLKPNESSEKAALRELFEETGYKAGNIHYVYSFYLSNSMSNERMHLYQADDLVKSDTHIHGELLETDMEIKIFEVSELQKMLDSQILTDAPSLIAVQYFLMQQHLQSVSNG